MSKVVTVTGTKAKVTTVGVQGPPGTGFNWKGTWDSVTQYQINDVVLFNGSLYIATAANLNQQPDTGGDWDLYLAPDVDFTYIHTQSTAAMTWTINHNMGKKPNIDLFDASGNPMGGNVRHTDLNTSTVSFNTAETGEAICN